MLHLFGLSLFVKQKTYGIGAISLLALLCFSGPVVGLSGDEVAAVKKACRETSFTCIVGCSKAYGVEGIDYQLCKKICNNAKVACLASVASGVRPKGVMGGGGILERDQGFGTQGPGATGVPQVGGRGAAPAGQIR